MNQSQAGRTCKVSMRSGPAPSGTSRTTVIVERVISPAYTEAHNFLWFLWHSRFGSVREGKCWCCDARHFSRVITDSILGIRLLNRVVDAAIRVLNWFYSSRSDDAVPCNRPTGATDSTLIVLPLTAPATITLSPAYSSSSDSWPFKIKRLLPSTRA